MLTFDVAGELAISEDLANADLAGHGLSLGLSNSFKSSDLPGLSFAPVSARMAGDAGSIAQLRLEQLDAFSFDFGDPFAAASGQQTQPATAAINPESVRVVEPTDAPVAPNAPSILAAGDIAIVAYQSDNTGGSLNREFFQFVLLTAVGSGTALYFTDAGYRTDTGKWNATGGAGGTATEGVVRWTAQTDLPAGTVITYLGGASNTTASTTEWQFVDAATGANIATNNLSLSNTGDSIYAIFNPTFGGTDNLGGTAITAMFWGVSSVTGDGFDPTFPTTQPSVGTALAPGLTDGVNAMAMSRIGGAGGNLVANGRYDDTIAGTIEVGTAAQIRASIMNEANWTRGTGGTPITPVSGHTTGTFNVAGPTTLAAGDIAFSAYQADNSGGDYNGDAFEFVLLKAVNAGTIIYFTDGGFQTNTLRYRTNEGLVRWTAQTDLAAGTIVTFRGNGAAVFVNTPEWTGLDPATGAVITTGTFSLAAAGDSIHAFQSAVFGGANALNGTAIAAMSIGGPDGFEAVHTSTSSNAETGLATGLTDGVNAVSFIGRANARYDETAVGSIEVGTAAQIRASLNTDTFWLTLLTQGSGPGSGVFNPGGHTQGTFQISAGTIDIAPTAISQNEGNSGTTAYSHTITRSSTTADTSVQVTIAAGTGLTAADIASVTVNGVAVAGFTLGTAFTVTLTGANTSATVVVNVAGDTAVESNETFTLTLTAPTAGYSLGTTVATDTIVNDDVNLPPTAVADSFGVLANAATALTVLANDTDPENDPITIASINGTAIAVGGTATLASGAQVTRNANGTLTYNPNGAFDGLISAAKAAATGASNTAATDVFNYAVNGGSTAAVTVTITGVDGPGDQLLGTSGVNTITGTNGADFIDGLGGADTLSGGDGDDTIVAEVSDQVLDGGIGTDTIRFGTSGTLTATLTGFEALNLTGGANVTMTQTQFFAGFSTASTLSGVGTLTINMGAGDSELYLNTLSGVSTLTVVSNGTANDDVIKGVTLSPNTINGGDGFDSLRGGSLADTINGGNGNDKIEGAGGADILTGGAGNDVFRYQSASASGLGAAADRITDFVIGTDKLGFSLMDADALAVGDQAFSFLGTGAFSNTGIGQIRYQNSGGDLLVQVDSDGNGVADMEIVLQGLFGQTLTSANFNL